MPSLRLYSLLSSFFMRRSKSIGDPSLGLVDHVRLRRGQPQGDVRWLHRLLHHCYQLLPQLVQLDLVAQRGTKSRQGLGCVILAAIEAAINNLLDTTA